MEYTELVAAYGRRADSTAVPAVVAAAAPARRLRDAGEPLAMHAVWSPGTNAALTALGMPTLAAYVGGRAASLGEPAASVVVSSFAWFEPGLVIGLYATARSAVPRLALLAARDAATAASLRAILPADREQVDEVGGLIADAVEAADGTGRPMFSGLRERGRPSDPWQRLWWACDLVREHRGDSHVVAAGAAGVGPVEMNVLTELWIGMPLLSYAATRGWPPQALSAAVQALERRGWLLDGELTPAGTVARTEIETRTDAQEQSIVDALGDRLPQVCLRLDDWSARCIAAGAFPPDILKRAAG